MESHKFTYTVSGVKLSDVQKHEISQAIGSAVTTVLIGHSSKLVTSDALSLHKIWGGIWALPSELGATARTEVEALAERAER